MSIKSGLRYIWADVYDFLSDVIENYTGTEEFMIAQLLQFLKEQGLGRMEPITMDGILSCYPYQSFISNMDVLFEEIKDYPWEENCKFLKRLNSERYNPKFYRRRWGRKGIDFFSPWRPGLFVGVLIDGEDHCLKPLDEKKGPDFVVFLEFDYSKKNKIAVREEFLSKHGFQELVNNLQREHGNFYFIKEHPESPWRVLILRKSLFDIFKGTNNYREQVNKVYETACQGINLLTQITLSVFLTRAVLIFR